MWAQTQESGAHLYKQMKGIWQKVCLPLVKNLKTIE